VHLKFNTHKVREQHDYNIDTREMGMFITQVDTDALQLYSRALLAFWRSKLFKKSISKLYVKWTTLKAYYRYKYFLGQHINLANSKYTYQWIRKVYGNSIPVEMLYPPVDVDNFRAAETKEKAIISVGRFFVGGHNKKQLELIKAFKRMYDNYPEVRDYTLHICGGTHSEKHHQDYLKLCRLSAQGYPIVIHANIPFQELISLYATAKIFWHAAGMHENEQLHPDKFEHFGITTVEAMASGCVPVVIGVAGQKEIVKHKENGLLWQTENELIEYTLHLINNVKACTELASKAIVSAKKFSRETFDERVRYLFEKVI
jgi:glycosyltransferase involved in cell wall biosynthesis